MRPGATVMPHNLYLHSSIVQTRSVRRDPASLLEAVRYTRVDTTISLLIAMVINATILILAATVDAVSRLRSGGTSRS